MKNFSIHAKWLAGITITLAVGIAFTFQNCSRYELVKNGSGNGVNAGGVTDNGNNGGGGGSANSPMLEVAPATPIVGDSVTFTITDASAPANTVYNWMFLPINATTPNILQTSANTTLTIPQAVTNTHAGTYWVERGTIKSNEVTLTVVNGINQSAQIFIDNLIGLITDNLALPNAVRDMISDDANLAFDCLQKNTNCSQETNKDRTVAHLYNDNGTLLLDDANLPNVGFDYDRVKCTTYHANPVDDACPFRPVVVWDPKCPTGMTTCENSELIHNFIVTVHYSTPVNTTAPPEVVNLPVASELMQLVPCETNLTGTAVRIFTLQADKVTKNYYCLFQTCTMGYFLATDRRSCVTGVRITPIANGSITEKWDGSTYVYDSITCNTGYHAEGRVCVSNTRTTPIANGTRTEIWNGSSWVFSSVTCNTGYTASGQSCTLACVSASWSAIQTEPVSSCTSSCTRRTYRTCQAGTSCGTQQYCVGASHQVGCDQSVTFGTQTFCIRPRMSTQYTIGSVEYMGSASCSAGQGACTARTTCSGDIRKAGASNATDQGRGWSYLGCQQRCGSLNAGAGYWHDGTTQCLCGSPTSLVISIGSCDGCHAFDCR